jgi:hypothetical protein
LSLLLILKLSRPWRTLTIKKVTSSRGWQRRRKSHQMGCKIGRWELEAVKRSQSPLPTAIEVLVQRSRRA